jgi:hypothetical protein
MNVSQQFKAFQNFSMIAATIVFLGTLLGCAKYKPHSFTKPVGPVVEKDDVKVVAQLLSEADCTHYFSRRMLKKGYQPVQIYIQNKSDQSFVFDTATINMPVENRDHVASCVHLDATQRAVGWGVGGLFAWPFFIPAVVEALQVPKVNKMLDDDFESRVLDMNSRVTIRPHASLNSVFFVRKENVSHVLQLSLKDADTEIFTDFSMNVG